jgi:hypothetical protein
MVVTATGMGTQMGQIATMLTRWLPSSPCSASSTT